MGFIRGEKTLTPFETYGFGTVRVRTLQIMHVLALLLGTCKRNYINTKRGLPKKISADVAGALISILTITVIVPVKLAGFVEYLVSLVYSVVGTVLYSLISRIDAINTLLWFVESLFPRLEVQKLIVVLELEKEPCTCASSAQFIRLGMYKEVNWICNGCAENYKRIRDLGAAESEIRFTNIRGCVLSEFAPLEASAVIGNDGSLRDWFNKEHLIHSVYDLEMLKWRRTYIKLVDTDCGHLSYTLSGDRTEIITYPIYNRTEDFAISKSFSRASNDWNKLGHARYNNKNRGFIKIAGSGLLLALQAAFGLLQVRNETDTMKALAIVASTQLAWFQVLSEVLLGDVPPDVIGQQDFVRVSVNRAKAINYLQRGDKQNMFSSTNTSWYTKTTLVGSGEAGPVKPLELLLNANRLVTKTMMFDFSGSGITVYKSKVKIEDYLCSIEQGRTYAPVWELSDLEKVPEGCNVK